MPLVNRPGSFASLGRPASQSIPPDRRLAGPVDTLRPCSAKIRTSGNSRGQSYRTQLRGWPVTWRSSSALSCTQLCTSAVCSLFTPPTIAITFGRRLRAGVFAGSGARLNAPNRSGKSGAMAPSARGCSSLKENRKVSQTYFPGNTCCSSAPAPRKAVQTQQSPRCHSPALMDTQQVNPPLSG
jgi:hypothetical protein